MANARVSATQVEALPGQFAHSSLFVPSPVKCTSRSPSKAGTKRAKGSPMASGPRSSAGAEDKAATQSTYGDPSVEGLSQLSDIIELASQGGPGTTADKQP